MGDGDLRDYFRVITAFEAAAIFSTSVYVNGTCMSGSSVGIQAAHAPGSVTAVTAFGHSFAATIVETVTAGVAWSTIATLATVSAITAISAITAVTAGLTITTVAITVATVGNALCHLLLISAFLSLF